MSKPPVKSDRQKKGEHMDLKRLRDPFPEDDVEWRVGRSGTSGDGKPWAMVLAYITNRAIMDRLDEVCGPGNWKNEYREWQGGQLCGIGILIPNDGLQLATWVTKWDGAENTDFESVKGGLSASMKRAAVQWGIGRYLYRLDEGFATCEPEKQKGKQWRFAKTKDGTKFWWKPPALPKWALPQKSNRDASAKPEPEPPSEPQEPTAKSDVQEFLRSAGCKTVEDAEKILGFITAGEVTKVTQYKNSDIVAAKVVDAIRKSPVSVTKILEAAKVPDSPPPAI